MEDQYNAYQLFYVEAILTDSSFPQLNRIKPIFEELTFEGFLEMVERVFETDDHETVQQFLYFLLLFRDMEHIRQYINHDGFPSHRLERLVIFIYGYCTMYDHSTERVIDEVLSFIGDERLIDLALNSDFIAQDKLFLFLILSKFNTEQLNRYISTIKSPEDFVKSFLRLPDNVLSSLVSRNYHLFQYVMMMIDELKLEDIVDMDFFTRYRKDIEHFSRLSDMVRKYKKKVEGQDKPTFLGGRDMGRVAFLVTMVREFPDPDGAIAYFDGEGVFIDEFERKVVKAILTDPILRNSFDNYDNLFSG